MVAAQKEDAAKRILFIVLIVIIFVSMLGTWTILSAIDQTQARRVTYVTKVVEQGPPATGYVTMNILPSKQRKGQEGSAER